MENQSFNIYMEYYYRLPMGSSVHLYEKANLSALIGDIFDHSKMCMLKCKCIYIYKGGGRPWGLVTVMRPSWLHMADHILLKQALQVTWRGPLKNESTVDNIQSHFCQLISHLVPFSKHFFEAHHPAFSQPNFTLLDHI